MLQLLGHVPREGAAFEGEEVADFVQLVLVVLGVLGRLVALTEECRAELHIVDNFLKSNIP